jgi:hypothetical protein
MDSLYQRNGETIAFARRDLAVSGTGASSVAQVVDILGVGDGLEQPVMLGNMRANGVRTLATWCLGRDRNHFRRRKCRERCAARLWFVGSPAVCYRLGRSRVHLGNVG